MLELITQKDQDFLQNIENLDEEYIQKFIKPLYKSKSFDT